VTSGTGPSPQGYLVAANNALTGNGLAYDLHDGTGAPRGNVINDGSNSYTYDAEGRLYSVDGTTCYTYDGDGDLVAKTNCNVVNAGNGGTTGITAEFLYDTNHRLMARVDVSTELTTAANIYAGGQLIAEDLPDPFVTTPTATLLRVTDQVGTLRGLLDLGEHQVESCTSFPYGDGVTCSSAADKQFFTGKWRLPESQLDYFGARYYNSTLGRFTSPDYSDDEDGPVSVPFYNPSNPQSLNLYSYTRNNPITGTDPDGHDCVVQSRTSASTESVSVSSGTCDGVSVGDGQSKTYVPGTVTGISVNGGNSLDISYNSYDGQSSGVTNAASAPYPDRPNLAYNFGNNPQGYQQVAASGRFVTNATVVAGIAYSAAFLGPAAYSALAGEAEGEAVGLTEHGAQRLAQRGISPEQAKAAIQAAKQAGDVVTKIGKYGTPQSIYTANGIRVVVEEAGANAGKIITAFFK
jgi:RHS repeat-associated protein